MKPPRKLSTNKAASRGPLQARLVVSVGFWKHPEELDLNDRRPRVLFFYAPWCELSDKLGKDLVQSGINHSNGVDFVAINAEDKKYAALVDRYNADMLPLVVFIGSSGSPVSMMQGYTGPGAVKSAVEMILSDVERSNSLRMANR